MVSADMLNPMNRKNLKSTVGYLLLNRLRTGENSDYKEAVQRAKKWIILIYYT